MRLLKDPKAQPRAQEFDRSQDAVGEQASGDAPASAALRPVPLLSQSLPEASNRPRFGQSVTTCDTSEGKQRPRARGRTSHSTLRPVMRMRSEAGGKKGGGRPVSRAAFLLLTLTLCGLGLGRAQVGPTATQALALSAFGGATGDYTGLGGGRNLSITAGADLEFRTRQLFGLQPAAEVRGTYPVNSGQVDGQKNILGGVRESWHYGRLRPYGDILVGAGRLTYVHGLPDPSNRFLYLQSNSFVISPGGGAELRLTDRFALRGDVQLQRYSSPVSVSGHIYAKPITFAIVYRFDRNHFAGRFLP